MRQAPRHFVTWVALSATNEREYVIVLEPNVGNSSAFDPPPPLLPPWL